MNKKNGYSGLIRSQLGFFVFWGKLTLLRIIAIQSLVFFMIFNLLSWFKELSMLETDSQLNQEYFTLTTIMDEPIEIKANGKKTIIYFFAPWCQICHLSIENLQAQYQKNQNIDVIAIALDYMNKQEIENFSIQHQLTFPIALGNEKVKKAFKIKGYPSYYILDGDNTVVSRSIGYSSEIGLYLKSF